MEFPKTAPGLIVSAPLLIVANLVPLAGVVWLGWDVFHVLFLMWVENVVVGAVNLLRIASAAGDGQRAMHLVKPVAMAAFLFHFGIFTTAHGQMLLTLLGEPVLGWSPGDWGPDFFGPPFYALAELWPALWPGVCAITVSHLGSYAANDLWQGELRRTKVMETMKVPYYRLVPVHLAVCFGAVAVEVSGSGTGLLALLIALKTAADLVMHLRQHRGR